MKLSGRPKRNLPLSLLLLAGLVFITLGCGLSNFEIWSASRILEDDERASVLNTAAAINAEATAQSLPPVIDEELLTNSAQEYAWQFGTRCIDSPGDDPCPLDACVVAADQYSASYNVTSELFGKANPDNYQCCADFSFSNNTDDEMALMAFYPAIDTWNSTQIHANSVVDWGNCSVSYSRHDGEVSVIEGISQIIVAYYNPHCDWLEHNEPGLQKYIVPIERPCIPD